jgi:hypothetical protein
VNWRCGSNGRELLLFNCEALSSTQFNQKKKKARCRWLTPVILATQETESRRIAV